MTTRTIPATYNNANEVASISDLLATINFTCYGPNCCRIFGRIVTVGISAHFLRVGRIVENPGEVVEVRMVKLEV
jgi:hypothetical protein